MTMWNRMYRRVYEACLSNVSRWSPTTVSDALKRPLQCLPGIYLLCLVPMGWIGCLYFPISFSLYFMFLSLVSFIQSCRNVKGLVTAIHSVKECATTPWKQKYYQETSKSHEKDRLDFEQVRHVILLPNYKEEMDTLCETLDVLASHDMAATQYKVCLAMESSEEASLKKAKTLCKLYADSFYSITFTLHPKDLPGEVRGKSSNVAWAAIKMSQECQQEGSQSQEVIFTVMDADTCFAQDYFTCMTYHYCKASIEDRQKMMFAPCTLFDRNARQVPFIVRATDICWSIAVMSNLYPSSSIKIPCSAYSLSMDLARFTGFWDTNEEAMGEDMHMYLKCFFATQGNIIVTPIYSPASQCNIEGSGSSKVTAFVDGIRSRYEQSKRHLWGSLDTSFIIRRGIMNIMAPGMDWIHQEYAKRGHVEQGSSCRVWQEEAERQVPLGRLLALYYKVMEAHLFIAHHLILVICVAPMIPLGSFFDFPEFQSVLLDIIHTCLFPIYIFGTHIHPFLYRVMWICGYMRALGLIPLILSFYYYEKYHHFAGFERWILQGEEYCAASLTSNNRKPAFSKSVVAMENRHLKVERLGKRPQLYSHRTHWNHLDWIGAPISLVLYYLAPLIQSQISHLISPKLEYTVAAKPTLMMHQTSHGSCSSLADLVDQVHIPVEETVMIDKSSLQPTYFVNLSTSSTTADKPPFIVDHIAEQAAHATHLVYAKHHPRYQHRHSGSFSSNISHTSQSTRKSDEGYYEEFDSCSDMNMSVVSHTTSR